MLAEKPRAVKLQRNPAILKLILPFGRVEHKLGAMHKAVAFILVSMALSPCAVRGAQAGSEIDDITGKYHFLSPQDTLALLDEDGRLKGWMDVLQEGDESDDILSFQVAQGTRTKDHVEFKTSKIHQRYYRFSGTVQRGTGRKRGDPDYLRLAGDIEAITVSGETGAETVEKKAVVFKSKGKAESDDEP